MKTLKANIWSLHFTHFIVIPTNAGFTLSGYNVMGAGLAKEAFIRYPDLPWVYGRFCQRTKNRLGIYRKYQLILLPTKPKNLQQPWLSWKQDSSLPLIEKGLKTLQKFAEKNPNLKIAVPLLGCGNGNLQASNVEPIIHYYLGRLKNCVLVKR